MSLLGLCYIEEVSTCITIKCTDWAINFHGFGALGWLVVCFATLAIMLRNRSEEQLGIL